VSGGLRLNCLAWLAGVDTEVLVAVRIREAVVDRVRAAVPGTDVSLPTVDSAPLRQPAITRPRPGSRTLLTRRRIRQRLSAGYGSRFTLLVVLSGRCRRPSAEPAGYRGPKRGEPVVTVQAAVIVLFGQVRVVAGSRGDPLCGLVDAHLLGGNLTDRVDGDERRRGTEAKNSTVLDAQHPDRSRFGVDEQVVHGPDFRAVAVHDCAPAYIFTRICDCAAGVAQQYQGFRRMLDRRSLLLSEPIRSDRLGRDQGPCTRPRDDYANEAPPIARRGIAPGHADDHCNRYRCQRYRCASPAGHDEALRTAWATHSHDWCCSMICVAVSVRDVPVSAARARNVR
jgi:hypothetical protein